MGIIDPKQHVDELDRELDDIQDTKEVPEKYKGKSTEDLIRMHEEAERKASRLGNEVGQLRSQLQPRVEPKEPVKKEVKVDDLLENPEEAVTTVVDQHPTVRKLNKTVEELETSLHKREFVANHPDYEQDLDNEDFIKWIQASPSRRALANAADKYDFVAAGELWNLWDERNKLISEVETKKKEQKQEQRKAALKAGTLESGTGNSTESKKILSRNEIIDLKHRAALGDRKAQAIVDDPRWQAEVRAAYREGRAR